MRPNPTARYAYDGNDGHVSYAHVKSHPDRLSNARAPRATYAEVVRREKPPARLQKQKSHRFPNRHHSRELYRTPKAQQRKARWVLKDQANQRRSSEPPHIASRDIRQRAADGPERLATKADAMKGRRQQQPLLPRGQRVIANVAAVRCHPAERKGSLSLEHPPRSASRKKHNVQKR